MEIILKRDSLTKILSSLQSVVERRSGTQILSNIMLRTVKTDNETGEIQCTATNLDMDLVLNCSATIKQPGITTVPAHLLHETVKRLNGEKDITCLHNNEKQRFLLNAGNFQCEFATLPESHFPVMLFGQNFISRFTISAQDFLRCLEKTKVAISTDDSRPYLNGVYVHAQEQDLAFVSTDGHRLAKAICTPKNQEGECKGSIIPRKTIFHMIDVLQLALQDKDEEVLLEITNNKIRLSASRGILTSKLLEGTFPEYERVIPANNDKKITVSVKQLREALGRVTLVTSDRAKIVDIHLNENALRISSQNPDLGMALEELRVFYKNEPFSIGFNAKYLTEIIDSISQDEVVLSFSNNRGPALMHGEKEDLVFYVLMPMWV